MMDFILAERARTSDASERFTRALELLGQTELSQRLAGIFALDGLWHEAGQESIHDAITEVLSAFVRRRAAASALAGNAPIQNAIIQATPPDVLSALTALGRAPQNGAASARPLDLHGIALREAYLPFSRFEGAFLYDCDFEGALLVGANLRGAWLARANLKRVNLDGADLRGADLRGARGLVPAHLQGVLHDDATRWP